MARTIPAGFVSRKLSWDPAALHRLEASYRDSGEHVSIQVHMGHLSASDVLWNRLDANLREQLEVEGSIPVAVKVSPFVVECGGVREGGGVGGVGAARGPPGVHPGGHVAAPEGRPHPRPPQAQPRLRRPRPRRRGVRRRPRATGPTGPPPSRLPAAHLYRPRWTCDTRSGACVGSVPISRASRASASLCPSSPRRMSSSRHTRLLQHYRALERWIRELQPGEPLSAALTRWESENPADISESEAAGKRKAAMLGARALLSMVFKHNFLHADMHPGNILIRLPDPATGPLSFPSPHFASIPSCPL